jgi:hypothetical protein
MCVAAKDAINSTGFGVDQSTSGDFGGETQPACVHPVEIAGKALVAHIELLDAIEQQLSSAAEKFVVEHKMVELVSVNGQVAQSVVGPNVAFEDRNSHKVGHYIGESSVVIAFHPHHFDIAFAIGEFADVGEELPMIAIEAGEIEVGEDVAEEY